MGERVRCRCKRHFRRSFLSRRCHPALALLAALSFLGGCLSIVESSTIYIIATCPIHLETCNHFLDPLIPESVRLLPPRCHSPTLLRAIPNASSSPTSTALSPCKIVGEPLAPSPTNRADIVLQAMTTWFAKPPHLYPHLSSPNAFPRPTT